MKKVWIILGAVLTVIIVIVVIAEAAGKNSLTSTSSSCNGLPTLPTVTASDTAALKAKVDQSLTYDIVSANPDQYKCRVVSWGGRVFTDAQKDQGAVYIQVFNTGTDKNFIVKYAQPNFAVKQDDYVTVIGVVRGTFSGSNLFGANLHVPSVEAGTVEKTSRSVAVAPAQVTVTANANSTQNGFSVTLERVELAQNETRFYLKIKNASQSKVSLSSYDAKATQGSKQYDVTSIFNSNENLPSDILPGVEATGALVFTAVDRSQKQLSLVLSRPYSDDYTQSWNSMTFTITLP